MLLCRGHPGIIWTRSINPTCGCLLPADGAGLFPDAIAAINLLGLPARGSAQGRDLRAARLSLTCARGEAFDRPVEKHAPLTPGKKLPNLFGEVENEPTGKVRRGAQAVPGREQPKRPSRAKRPDQLSLFGGGDRRRRWFEHLMFKHVHSPEVQEAARTWRRSGSYKAASHEAEEVIRHDLIFQPLPEDGLNRRSGRQQEADRRLPSARARTTASPPTTTLARADRNKRSAATSTPSNCSSGSRTKAARQRLVKRPSWSSTSVGARSPRICLRPRQPELEG